MRGQFPYNWKRSVICLRRANKCDDAGEQREHDGQAASVFVALLFGVTAIAWYAAPVAVPHALFYVVILALPYWWWSGLLVVPALIVIGWLWRVASAHPLSGDVA